MDPAGLDLPRFRDWFAAVMPDAGTLEATLIAGGRSNLTYLVTDGARRWVVRRPPLGHVLATAHDMSREYRVMQALRTTAVPVPRMVTLCEDESVLGAPFYVMDYVDGRPYRLAAELEPFGRDGVHALSQSLIDTLAVLHAVDPVTVGLADFGRPEGFLARQVSRWKKQLDASHHRDLPAADELHARLAASVPPEQPSGIVHGDYRLDNVLVTDDGTITAVLDWEMATLGDPLTDLALLMIYQRLGTIAGGLVIADAMSAPGFLDERGMLDRYARHTTRDLSHFGFYLGLAAFKLAVILEGINFRFINGQTVGPGFDRIGDVVQPLLDAGLSALED